MLEPFSCLLVKHVHNHTQPSVHPRIISRTLTMNHRLYIYTD